MTAANAARSNQRLRTRKDLLAAARLLKAGQATTPEQVAEAALVSRATAYRHFPNIEALLVEASFDVAFPDADKLFEGDDDNPIGRLRLADAAVEAMIAVNEPALRTMLAYNVRPGVVPDDAFVRRQNRRAPLIEAALAPLRAALALDAFDRLAMALALVIGTEAMVVFKDVVRVDDSTASEVRRWTIEALVAAALRDAKPRNNAASGPRS